MSYGKSLIECENHFEFDVNRSLRVGAGFDVLIPAYTLTKDNVSKRCVFTLKSMTIGKLDKNNAGSLIAIKEPLIIMDILGLGLRPSHFSIFYGNQGYVRELQNNSKFIIPNILSNNVQTNNVVPAGQGNSVIGNDSLDEQRLCSNPFGQSLRFKFKRHDDNDFAFIGGITFNIKFCIDFIDPKIDQNFV